MLSSQLLDLQSQQGGLIARRQLFAAGGAQTDIERMLRRREWVRILPGVFLNHTGQPTWHERAWAGVLFAWPAALSHHSALRAVAGPGWKPHDDRGTISLVIDDQRKVRAPTGYEVHRMNVRPGDPGAVEFWTATGAHRRGGDRRRGHR